MREEYNLKIHDSNILKKWNRIFFLGSALVLCLVLVQIPALAEHLFCRGIARSLSLFVNRLTNYLPVSLYELTVLLLILACPCIVALFIYLLCRRRWRAAAEFVRKILAAILAIIVAFTVLYGGGYRREPVTRYLGLTETELTDGDYLDAARYYVKELNEVSRQMRRDTSANIIPPMNFTELASVLNQEFSALTPDYFNFFTVQPKQVQLSVPMTYLGITGIYLPFFAESNINWNTASYGLPVLVAHEMSHAKGVSREDEANLTAYALCIRSNQPYLRYSGLAEAATSLLNALPEDDYNSLKKELDPAILREFANERRHYERYHSFLDELSDFINHLFLKANGVSDGIKSYSDTAKRLVYLYQSIR